MKHVLLLPLLVTATLPLVPTAEASSPPSYCSASPYAGGSASCTFHCNAGDVIRLYVNAYDGATSSGFASCDNQVASCTGGSSPGYVGGCHDESDGTTLLPSDTGTCTLTAHTGNTGMDGVYCEAVPADATLVAQEVPSTGTPQVGGEDVPTPGVSTPPVGSVASPAVGVPATCSAQPCTAPTPVGPVATPPVPEVCTPVVDVVCVGPAPPVTILPGTSVGPLCATVGAACLPGVVLVPAGAVTTPPVGAIPLVDPSGVPVPLLLPAGATPSAAVYVNGTFQGVGVPQVGWTEVGPVVIGGPLPVTICNTPCAVPYAYGNAWASVAVSVDGQTTTVPVTA